MERGRFSRIVILNRGEAAIRFMRAARTWVTGRTKALAAVMSASSSARRLQAMLAQPYLSQGCVRNASRSAAAAMARLESALSQQCGRSQALMLDQAFASQAAARHGGKATMLPATLPCSPGVVLQYAFNH